jgi:hypothetical protein
MEPRMGEPSPEFSKKKAVFSASYNRDVSPVEMVRVHRFGTRTFLFGQTTWAMDFPAPFRKDVARLEKMAETDYIKAIYTDLQQLSAVAEQHYNEVKEAAATLAGDVKELRKEIKEDIRAGDKEIKENLTNKINEVKEHFVAKVDGLKTTYWLGICLAGGTLFVCVVGFLTLILMK